VYGQTDGQWVDEQSETSPRDATAHVLLEAEQCVLSTYPNSVVLRLAGIYGPSRKSLVERALVGLLPGQLGVHFVNRMYLPDCARAVEHLLHLDAAERLFIGADNEPASQRTVLTWLSEHFDLPPVPVDNSGQHCAPNHKRCRNTRLCQSGFYLEYPTFREGYAELALAAGLLPRRR
jgi:nucleoside-diphosphate-sugar epimerase